MPPDSGQPPQPCRFPLPPPFHSLDTVQEPTKHPAYVIAVMRRFMRTAPNLSVVLTAALAASGGTVFGGILPVTQSRKLDTSSSALAFSVSDSDLDAKFAPGFGPYDESSDAFSLAVFTSSSLPVTTIVSVADGIASQKSSITASRIQAIGEAGVSLTLTRGPLLGAGTAAGSSLFDVSFFINTDSEFSLSGFLDTQAIVTGGAPLPGLDNTFYLEEVGGPTLFQALTNDEAFALTGTFAGGKTYRLYGYAESSAFSGNSATLDRTVNGLSSFNFDLQVREIPNSPVIPEASTVIGALGLGTLCGLTWLVRRRRS